MLNAIGRHVAVFLLALLALASQVHAGPKEDIQADMHAGRWAQAEARLATVLDKHPRNSLAHYWQAQVKMQLGKVEEARAALDQAKSIDPEHQFAGDKGLLAALEAKLQLGVLDGGSRASEAMLRSEIASPSAAAPVLALDPAVARALGSEIKLPGDGWPIHMVMLGMLGLLVACAAAIVVVFAALGRSQERRQRRETVESLKSNVTSARRDLDDAVAASDANHALPPEAKLANYDRAKRPQSELAALAAQVDRAGADRDADLYRLSRDVMWLTGRARDIAADLRGDERPSARRERLEQERHARALAMARAHAATPVVVQHVHHDSGAGLAHLAAANWMMSSGSSRRHDSSPVSESSRVDLGGSSGPGGSDAGFSSVDTGGVSSSSSDSSFS